MAKPVLLLMAALCLLPNAPAVGWIALPPWGALLAGIAVTLLLGNPWVARTRKLTPTLLAASVVGLGAAMDLRTVAVVGLQGFGYTLVGIAGTLVVGAVLGRMLAVRQATGILVAVGTAICGGSAIAAASPAIGADDDETSAALGIVFLLNATALLLFPPIGHRLGLSDHAFGLWAALAIHDTSSVVGAAATYGPEALTIATTTKLARALWIVPVTLALGAWAARRKDAPRGPVRAKRPWFILGSASCRLCSRRAGWSRPGPSGCSCSRCSCSGWGSPGRRWPASGRAPSSSGCSCGSSLRARRSGRSSPAPSAERIGHIPAKSIPWVRITAPS
jgi:uncharacterized integral membrane protein (TIGR00698 family)